MSNDFHPSLIEHYISTNHRASVASWALAIASWALLATGIVTTDQSAKIGLFGASLGCCLIAKPVRGISISTERTRNDVRDISTQGFQNWLADRMKPDKAVVEFYREPEAELETYDFDTILDEAVGIALLGNSGSGKSSVAKYIVTLMGETQILVLDPHDDGDTWDGLPVISEYDDIVAQLALLLEELDQRRSQRKRKQKLEPVVIICDEFPAVRDYCSQIGSDVADRFILRFGSESRKFDMLCLFCSQSGNTKALGLDGKGDFLENYLLIRLHKVARKYAKNLSDRTVLARIKPEGCGFPCIVGDEVSVHPTHGHYPKFAKGLPPRNLKPLRSLPLTIPLAAKVAYQPLMQSQMMQGEKQRDDQHHPSSPHHPPITDPITYLEGCFNQPFTDSSPNNSPHHSPSSTPQNYPSDGALTEGDEEGDEFSIPDELLRDLILSYRQVNVKGQDAFIENYWGISKAGNNPRWIKARERYQAVCKKFGL